MVVAAVVVLLQRALGVDRASELAAPDDERFLEESAFLQFAEQGGGGLIGVVALGAQAGGAFVVLIPAAVIELNEAHAAFGEAPREDAIGRVGSGLLRFGAVALERAGRLLRQIRQFGNGGLHAKGHFVLLDAGPDPGILIVVEFQPVERGEVVEHGAAAIAG